MQDGREKISPHDFVTGLMLSFQHDSKRASLESLRRAMKGRPGRTISRSAFWERLSRQRLKTFLVETVSALMGHLHQGVDCGQRQLRQLGVCGIELIDSTSFSLHDSAEGDLPETFSAPSALFHGSTILVFLKLTCRPLNYLKFY